MNASVDRPGADQESVRVYLNTVLPECRLTSKSLRPDYAPFLLVWMTGRLAAFAFSNGDTNESYRTLYGSFKEYYLEHREQLDAVDLSFVFCVRPDMPRFDEFCAAVEMDVYFCRKFVISLADNLGRSLERLPFLPIASSGEPSARAPSAQSYMQQCGVPAMLSRYLAVPHQRGAENIVRDCIEGRHGWPPVLTRSVDSNAVPVQPERDVERVRLEKVTIQGFRAYKNAQQFDLGSGVTVLYGANGLGKTSIFDAIDFAATGGIGRLKGARKKSRFTKAVAHLDSRPEEAEVALSFGANGAVHTLHRRVSARTEAWIDGAVKDRKRALVEITGGGATPSERTEHLVSLFRATHLFSQENQELAKGFEPEGLLPAHVVAHMLAYEDYANARDKAAAVREVLDGYIGRRRSEIGVWTSEVDEGRQALRSLGRISGEDGAVPRPTEALTSLRRRIEEAGLQVRAAQSDVMFVRECRAAIQGRRRQGEARIARLTTLVEQVHALPTLIEALEKLGARKERLRAQLASEEQALGKSEQSVRDAEGAERALRETLLRERQRGVALLWAAGAVPRYGELLRREGAMVAAIAELTNTMEKLRSDRSQVVQELRDKEREINKLEESLSRHRSLLDGLQNVARSATAWQEDRVQIPRLQERQARHRERVTRLQQDQGNVSQSLTESSAVAHELEKQLSHYLSEQSELAQLRSRMEDYIGDGCCPLCGHRHASADELRGRIETQFAEDETVHLRNRIASARNVMEEIEAQLLLLQQDAEEQSRALEELERESLECGARVAVFEEAAVTLGVVVDEKDAVVTKVEGLLMHERTTVGELERIVATGHQMRAKLSERLEELVRRMGRNESRTSAIREEVEQCQAELARLREDPRGAALSLEMNAKALRDVCERRAAQLAKLETELPIVVSVADECRTARNARRDKVAALTFSLERLNKDLGSQRRGVGEANAGLAEVGLSPAANKADVVGVMGREIRVNRQWAELRDFADSVEVAIDTASTAAALERHRAMVDQKVAQLREATIDAASHEEWRRYFDEVNEKVSHRQRAAIADFAGGYGAIASVIQQRLRSAYGFGGIDTRSHGPTIRVTVRRSGERLRPTDYFSQSQQRTLFLGLFLAACMSQTWSSLSAVLLDEPVTHFDDLNTYAFLDMVGGLLSSESSRLQFVISTCDRRVFRLARNKFRHLGEEARFYEFAGIGSDGPAVCQV